MPENWTSIKDFSPGIHQRLSPDYPPGTAAPDHTFGCYSLEGGALSPLPFRKTQDIGVILQDILVTDGAGQTEAEEFRICGLHVTGPHYWGADPFPGIEENHTEIWVGVESWVAGAYYVRLYRYKRHYKSAPHWEVIWTSDGDGGEYDPRVRPRHMSFGMQRSNYLSAPAGNQPLPDGTAPATDHAGPGTRSGPTVLGWVVSGYARFFPDDSDPASLSTVALPGDKSYPGNLSVFGQFVMPDTLVMHQGRAVIFPLTVIPFGPGSVFTHNECMFWTEFNNLRMLGSYGQTDMDGDGLNLLYEPNWFNITVGPENPVGYGVTASLTANELLLIKNSGGALIIQGDVSGVGPSSPQARTLPYVKSTGQSMNNGAYGPTGYVYPVDGGGVWLWQGGDTSQHLTKHLLPEFWRPPAVDLDGEDVQWGDQWTQCAAANNWVLFPNNWLWDTDMGGWWRTNDPSTFIAHRWATDVRSNFAYATPRGFRDQSDPTVQEFNLNEFAVEYQWQSQPLATTLDSTVSCMDVALVTTGNGVLRVTVSTLEQPQGVARTFISSSPNFPSVQRQTFGVRGTHLVFKVEAFADDSNDPAGAPTVHELRYTTGVDTPLRR